jgi:phospholipase C
VGGWVATETFGHTSTLRLLERLTGVPEPNISEWRRGAFGDLTSAFRFADGSTPAPAPPDDTPEQLAKAQTDVATLPKPTLPGADQIFPVQETGRRPQR